MVNRVTHVVTFHGEQHRLCLDCAAALGGEREELSQEGEPCPSCVEAEADTARWADEDRQQNEAMALASEGEQAP